MANIVYEIVTDLDPKELSLAGLEVFRMWADFALGRTKIGKLQIKHPTGRMAAALSRQTTPSVVTIMVDEGQAPEALWLEEGHERYDMLAHRDRYPAGRRVPMRRGPFDGGGASGAQAIRRNPKVWAQIRRNGDPATLGFPIVPEERPSRNNRSGLDLAWVIPAMESYEPARIMAQLLAASRPGRIL